MLCATLDRDTANECTVFLVITLTLVITVININTSLERLPTLLADDRTLYASVVDFRPDYYCIVSAHTSDGGVD
jgi:hypothetical protein